MFFYLNWKDKRPSKPVLIKKKPDDINFEKQFKIKKEIYTICGYINPEFKDYVFKSQNKYTKSLYLSSHLQKSIRRMETTKSIQTAFHFINLDYNSFIRRLPIIMLEDVTVHESLSTLVWLMIANTKGFQLKEEIIKWLLGVVYYLSECTEFTFYSKNDGNIFINFNEDIILHTLSFRKSYGGMKGDMKMIEYYIHNIINGNINVKGGKINIIKLEIGELEYNKWLKCANDFHCNKYIIQYIKNKHIFDEEYIKKLIWYFSSSYNKRYPVVEYSKSENEDWNKIKKDVLSFQKKCKFY